jgi:hypothetical protein
MPNHVRLLEPLPMEMGLRKKHHQVVRYFVWFGLEVKDIDAFYPTKSRKNCYFGVQSTFHW